MTPLLLMMIALVGAEPSPSSRLSVERFLVKQDGGAWVVDYKVKNLTDEGVIISPSDVEIEAEGQVSNSRADGHSIPRRSYAKTQHHTFAEVIPGEKLVPTCTERVALALWDDQADPDPFDVPKEDPTPVSLPPGGEGLLRVRFEHHHVVQGAYDPLLGVRTVAVRIGQETFHDQVPLDRELRTAHHWRGWEEPPEERRDPERYVSAPDSLHLEGHIPGRQYYRFPDRPVRYGSRMKLTFWYLVANGTPGECRIRLAQYKDTPTSCRVLPTGGWDRELKPVFRWTKVEWLVTTEREATTLALDFRISNDENMGEMWLDDVSLEPLHESPPGGP